MGVLFGCAAQCTRATEISIVAITYSPGAFEPVFTRVSALAVLPGAGSMVMVIF
jgi:hypothetical protein